MGNRCFSQLLTINLVFFLVFFSFPSPGCGAGLVAKSYWTLATPWTRARQAPLSMGYFQARILERVVIPSPGDLPDPGIEPGALALQADSLLTELSGNSHPLLNIFLLL